MKLKHTPGKWVIMPEEVGRDYLRIRGSALGRKYKIANVLHAGDIFNNLYEKAPEEVGANARLIAAAPDMLDALIKTISVMCACCCETNSCSTHQLLHGHKCDQYEACKSAIESATGLPIEEVLK